MRFVSVVSDVSVVPLHPLVHKKGKALFLCLVAEASLMTRHVEAAHYQWNSLPLNVLSQRQAWRGRVISMPYGPA